MPGQGIVGSPRGEAEPLGDLAGASGPAQQLGGFDLGAELGADDAQQHDGRGLLAPLLVGRGRFFGLGEACGEIQIGLVLKCCKQREGTGCRRKGIVSRQKERRRRIPFNSKNLPSTPAKSSWGQKNPALTSGFVHSVTEEPWNSGSFLLALNRQVGMIIGLKRWGFFRVSFGHDV